MLVKTARAYDSKIAITCGGYSVNAKNILGILTLGAVQGAEVTIVTRGRDAAAATRAIEALFACCFHEPMGSSGLDFSRTGRLSCGIA